ncbi:ribonuclease H-like domain-containing protein [Calycina marina]|uniref:Ribonuclease H-like domain-containing protein n=1 Tax=Calycina marina TaxID=1763456 RepID=A0A9P7ZAF2_9HELO|nr:ribonuclease H-like domain-containing protein [Calycina marina]
MVCANTSLKLNFKLGGTNHTVKGESWGGALADTIIVCADVGHVPKDSDSGCPSISSVVATQDAENKSQFIAGLASMIEERVLAYNTNMKKLPQNMLFYRNEINESQYGMAYSDEVPLIKKGRKTTDWTRKITVIVVGKGYHPRFFPDQSRNLNHFSAEAADKERKKNIEEGLVIEHSTVYPTHLNFYLQSHNSPDGIVRSAYYVVIYDEFNYTLEQLQSIVSNHSPGHLYSRENGF